MQGFKCIYLVKNCSDGYLVEAIMISVGYLFIPQYEQKSVRTNKCSTSMFEENNIVKNTDITVYIKADGTPWEMTQSK